jgi:hypothetical protein
MHYDAEQNRVQMNSLMEYFAKERFEKIGSRFANDSSVPIFAVGMPRSGTTLVEQIIASHPDVHGAGELPFVERMVRRMPGRVKPRRAFPHALDVLSVEEGIASPHPVGSPSLRVVPKGSVSARPFRAISGSLKR